MICSWGTLMILTHKSFVRSSLKATKQTCQSCQSSTCTFNSVRTFFPTFAPIPFLFQYVHSASHVLMWDVRLISCFIKPFFILVPGLSIQSLSSHLVISLSANLVGQHKSFHLPCQDFSFAFLKGNNFSCARSNKTAIALERQSNQWIILSAGTEITWALYCLLFCTPLSWSKCCLS